MDKVLKMRRCTCSVVYMYIPSKVCLQIVAHGANSDTTLWCHKMFSYKLIYYITCNENAQLPNEPAESPGELWISFYHCPRWVLEDCFSPDCPGITTIPVCGHTPCITTACLYYVPHIQCNKLVFQTFAITVISLGTPLTKPWGYVQLS